MYLAIVGLAAALAAWADQDDGTEDGEPASAKAVAADQEALARFNSFIGSWRGGGQLQRGSTKGAWIEDADWAWDFHEDGAAIEFDAPEGKYFVSGRFSPGAEADQFELVATPHEGDDLVFQGSFDDEDRLVLVCEGASADQPARVTLRQVAGGDRLVILLERRIESSGRYVRIAEIGYTREGGSFAQAASGPECVVTGGLGVIEVEYQGRTYFVCCSGCRDLFRDDPEGVLAAYRARKEEERRQEKR